MLLRKSIELENTLSDIIHLWNSEVELWPETIRRMLMLNNTGRNDLEPEPFESWVGPPGLEKKKKKTGDSCLDRPRPIFRARAPH